MRSYVKVARPADTNTRYTAQRAVVGNEGGDGTGTGPKGEKGEKGDTGPAGPTGPAGENGKDGVDGKDGIDANNEEVELRIKEGEDKQALIEEHLQGLGLETVLTGGNLADKDIVLTDGSSDLIDISPTEGRVVVASLTDTKTPKLTLAHFGDHIDGNRKVDIELDQDGTRLDFEMSDSVKDVHFRFGTDEKFIINHQGDAEFLGRVTVDPGRVGHEVVTFQQLAEVEQSIDDISPALDKGEWLYTEGSTAPANGGYTLFSYLGDEQYCTTAYAECLANATTQEERGKCGRDFTECSDADVVPIYDISWSLSTYLAINVQDYEAHQHPFPKDYIPVGAQVEVLNIDGDGFGLYEITGAIGNTQGKQRTWTIEHKNSRGAPGNVASIKFFLPMIGRDEVYTKAEIDEMFANLSK